jgi:ADP-ribose pyrophosphatase YjhB (NUDIX family)
MINLVMRELPLSVVISALIYEDKILLIKRKKGDFVGLLALPGGKVERDEHLSQAAVREILEESGIESEFKKHLGFVSELLIENNNIMEHFLLHICELEPKTIIISNDVEGKLEWFNLSELEKLKEKIIPSDYHIIEKIVMKKEKEYYNSVLEKVKDEYILRKFE